MRSLERLSRNRLWRRREPNCSEVYPVGESPANTAAFPNIVNIRENHLEYTGFTNDHQVYNVNPALTGDSHGINVRYAYNLQIMDNSMTQIRGYGVQMDYCWQVGVSGNTISANSGPGYLSRIYNPAYPGIPTGGWILEDAWLRYGPGLPPF